MSEAVKTLEPNKSLVSTKDLMAKFKEIEKILGDTPGAKHGDDIAPLVHKFAGGQYIRQITMPAGMYILSKIHKTKHPYFILRGDVSVVTEKGVIRLVAPYSGITQAGTQRLLYIHSETVWTTVHVTDKTDLKEIEADLIAKSYDELPSSVKDKEFIP